MHEVPESRKEGPCPLCGGRRITVRERNTRLKENDPKWTYRREWRHITGCPTTGSLTCRKCGSSKVRGPGPNRKGEQLLTCLSCGARYTHVGDPPIKAASKERSANSRLALLEALGTEALTTVQAAKAAGVTSTTASAHLNTMEIEGLVSRVEGRWMRVG